MVIPIENEGNVTACNYILERAILFSPRDNTLTCIQSDQVVTLYISASRCLLHLIEHQGEILNQQTLMNIGWEQHGLTVSPNAYYQNISNIRRSLAAVYADKEIITTIKRSGLMISPDIFIEKVVNDIAVPVARAPVMASSNAESVVNDGEIVPRPTAQSVRQASESATFRLDNSTQIWAALLILTVVLGGLITVAIYQNNKLSYFSKYEYLKTLPQGCKVYMNKDAGISRKNNPRLSAISPDCKGLSKAYLTEWEHHRRFSFVYCSDSNEMLTCVSEYFGVDQ